MPERLAAHLASIDIFQGLDPATLDELESELEPITLPAGQALFKQGASGDSLYVLIKGDLDVVIDGETDHGTIVDQLAPPTTVGEMAVLTGQPRAATVTATSTAELIRLSRAAFDRLASEHPDLIDTFARGILARIRRTQLADILGTWFGPLHATQLREIQERVQWLSLASGQELFRQGDSGRHMYLVVSGRLQVEREDDSGAARVIGAVGRGESVGEVAILTDQPRSATVRAIRDSEVVKLQRTLVEGNSHVMARLAKTIAQRTAQRLRVSTRDNSTASSYAVLPLTGNAPAGELAEMLARSLDQWGPAQHLSSAAFDRRYGASGAAQTRQDDALNLTVTAWLNEQEAKCRYLIYEADAVWTQWSRRCVRQADRVLLVAPAGAAPAPGAVEAELRTMQVASPVDLVLIHPGELDRPSGTNEWLEPRSVAMHHHVRLGNDSDIPRLARRLSGRALGLVLSGGGARGYVHIGLLRAMGELGIDVDLIGGTSMGALIAAAYAHSHDYRFCQESATRFGDPKQIIDRTLPIVALTKSRRVNSILQALFGKVRIEDLWMPFFCVSANVSRSEPVIHQSGELWRAVRASSAIPGIFTPVLQDGDVLVDGGVMNNFPVDIMSDKVEGGTIIASNAYGRDESARSYNFGDSVSGWQVLWSRLNPFATSIRAPSMIGTLTRSTSVGSRYQMQAMAEIADIVINYPTDGYSSLQFDRHDELIDIGYEKAMTVLEAWLTERGAGAAERSVTRQGAVGRAWQGM